jgi:hypothetical protein
MDNEKIQNIKDLWNEFRNARQTEKTRMNSITSVSGIDSKKACFHCMGVVDGREAAMIKERCDDFKLDEKCSKKCVYNVRNSLFVEAHKEYVAARHDLLKGIFGRSK